MDNKSTIIAASDVITTAAVSALAVVLMVVSVIAEGVSADVVLEV